MYGGNQVRFDGLDDPFLLPRQGDHVLDSNWDAVEIGNDVDISLEDLQSLETFIIAGEYLRPNRKRSKKDVDREEEEEVEVEEVEVEELDPDEVKENEEEDKVEDEEVKNRKSKKRKGGKQTKSTPTKTTRTSRSSSRRK
jgi:hypothetical protein